MRVLSIRKKIHSRIISFLDKLIAALARLISPGRKPSSDLHNFGGYLVDIRTIGPKSVVYSFGVGVNIDFDELFSEKFGCKVWMFDPTPPACEFISAKKLSPLLFFEPLGVWTAPGMFKFYTDGKASTEIKRNFSITNFFKASTFVSVPCQTLPRLMEERHHTHIDLLKIDIEGAAIAVLTDMLERKIFPAQIVGEIEIPKLRYHASLLDIAREMRRKATVLKLLEEAGYTLFTYSKGEFTAIRSLS